MTQPAFVEKPPAVSAAMAPIDRLKYFNEAVGHSAGGVLTKSYAYQAKHREAHRLSKTWTWPDGNVQGQVYRHNRASYHAAEFMRNELLGKVNERQGLLLDIDFVETFNVYSGVTYFGGLVGVIATSWDEAALKKAITAGAIRVDLFGQVVTV